LRRLLPGLWLGLLLTVALVATPAAFALLGKADAGRVMARVLASEAYASLAFGALLLALERLSAKRAAEAQGGAQFNAGMGCAAVALFCTVAGYFGVLPLMDQARAGQGPLGFGALHGISAGFFVVKGLAVAVLAWRASAPALRPAASS
jgi:Domain of unknown function (DUF4149)